MTRTFEMRRLHRSDLIALCIPTLVIVMAILAWVASEGRQNPGTDNPQPQRVIKLVRPVSPGGQAATLVEPGSAWPYTAGWN
jgi:hypothetical protein